jgi:hypothetical protein
VRALNVEDHNGQAPRVGDLDRRLVEIEEDLMQELTRSNGQQRPVVWTQAVLCNAGMGVPAGLLVVEGRAQGCGKIMQSIQCLMCQKGQMFFCKRGRQAWHAKWTGTANRFTCVGIQILEAISGCLRYK